MNKNEKKDRNVKKYRIIMGCIGVIFLLILLINISTDFSTPTDLKLGQYMDLEANTTEVTVTDIDVENAMIDDVVASQDNVNISNRPVRIGDVVNIDYVGKVDSVAFDGGTDTGYDLEIGSGTFIDGFEDQIIGMVVGQTSDINVTFPDDYSNTDLAGKAAVFTVKVNSILGKVIPDVITDDMIKNISDTYTTVADYLTYVREQLEKQVEETNKQNKYNAVWNIVTKNATINSLSSEKISYYARLYESNYQSYANMYDIALSEFITSYMGITTDQFISYKNSYAEKAATKYGIAEAIASEQSILVSDDEYQTYLTENNIDSSQTGQYGESVKDELLYQKVAEFVASKTTFIIIDK